MCEITFVYLRKLFFQKQYYTYEKDDYFRLMPVF